MNKQFSKIYTLIIILFCISIVKTFPQEKPGIQNIMDMLKASRVLHGHSGPRNLEWINGGNLYSYITKNDSGNTEIRSYNPETEEDNLIFSTAGIMFPGTTDEFNFSSYQWSKDLNYLGFNTNPDHSERHFPKADYYFYSINDRNVNLIAKHAGSAKLSPDSKFAGYEKDGNVFIYNINSNSVTRLTDDANDSVFNGHFDWVYAEELSMTKAWEWSPDSKFIAYWQFNESGVPVFQRTNYEGHHPKYVKFRVPMAGDTNPKVKIGIINVDTKKQSWLTPGDTGDYYIPRIYWTNEPEVLAVMYLNRAQNDLKLFFYDVVNGKRRLVMEEKSNKWIDVYDYNDHVENLMYFPKNINEFFWISDRNGYQQIYRYDYNGRLINQVTHGGWSVVQIAAINTDEKKLYFVSNEPTPLERQLYSINFDGTGKKRISQISGKHVFNVSPNCKYYIDTYSNITTPTQVDLCRSNGDLIKNLEQNAAAKDYILNHKYSVKELFSFMTGDSVNLDASIIKPPDFDNNKKYPLILSVYGGPGAQDVYNSFAASSWDQWLAQKGYIIANVNNRGNARYSKKFFKVVYKHLGKYESHDYAELVRYLSRFSYIDTSRVAIMGTSYGGYITIYTMLKYPSIFKVGLSNSAVTDWRFYDDIYTERYMGLVNENEDGYDSSSAITYAENLKGRLLLLHSAMDDNVHIQNTMQLLTAFANNEKNIDLRIFPPGGHGAIYNFPSLILMYKMYYNYLEQYLKGSCSGYNINNN